MSSRAAFQGAPVSAARLELVDLTVRYPVGRRSLGRRNGFVHAVEAVSLTVAEGEIVALVGESGCGKSSLARTVAGIHQPASGQVILDGVTLTGQRGQDVKRHRRAIQLIHQDPYDALDPRQTVRSIVLEGLRIHRHPRAERDERVRLALERVGLTPAARVLDRFPHQLSGGQRQRVAIASAIALAPRLLVADEPASMLDVSVRASVLRLFEELRSDGLGMLLITHDLASATVHADRIAVMFLGRIVEEGPARQVFREPRHPYTRALVSAMPQRDLTARPRVDLVSGEPVDAVNPPPGCAFASRCPVVMAECHDSAPPLRPITDAHRAACIRV
jgi:oligopeptide/dipeptide ABC transporter ATP-binding protein